MATDEVLIDDEESLSVQEQLFNACKQGNIRVFMELLDRKEELGIDLEGVDINGDTVLKGAIKEGYSVLVQQLLKHNIQVSDALLKAVDVGFAATVKVICEYAQNLPTNESRDAVLQCHCDDEEFHPDVTPIILAAQRNDFILVQILLNTGASIPENLKEVSTRASDSLQKSMGLLETCKALASEAYVTQKYADPVDRAFVLSDTLEKLSKTEVSFKSNYLELAETMNLVGTDIISGARSTEEILTVLSHHDGNEDENMGPLPKLSRAIQFDQRRFIAQSNCQQAVKSKFYGALSSIRDRSSSYRVFHLLSMLVTFPLLVLCYMYIPSQGIRKRMECPYVKFAMHLASDVFLISLITADVVVGENIASALTLNRPTRALILLWIVGIGWQVVGTIRKDQLVRSTRSKHKRNAVLVATFLIGAALDLTSYYYYPYLNADSLSTMSTLEPGGTLKTSNDFFMSNSTGEALYRIPKSVDIHHWNDSSAPNITTLLKYGTVDILPSYRRAQVSRGSPSNDEDDSNDKVQVYDEIVTAFLTLDWWHPHLFASAMFSIATVIAFLRMLSYVAASDVIGPLQISLWTMISKTVHFFVVLTLVILAIAVGLTYIYSYYNAVDYQVCISVKGQGNCSTGTLSNLMWVIIYLYWSLFGLEDPAHLELSTQAELLQSTGYCLYAMFFVLVGLVLLNSLIAVMTEVYNDIEINADIEWKFASTSLWLDFLQEGDVVPPPFNLLPSLDDIQWFLKFVKKELRPRRKPDILGKYYRQQRIKYEGIKMQKMWKRKANTSNKSQYQRVISRLVERYISSKTADELSVESDVNITDIRELRNDLLTLKFEMFQKLQNSVEDMYQTIGRGNKTRVKSIDANSIFKRADVLHSTVNRHLKYVLNFQDELEATVAAIPDPPETTEKEIQTVHCELTFDDMAAPDNGGIPDTPEVVTSTCASQTSSNWMVTKRTQTMPPGRHAIAMQTTREHLVDGRCQTIVPSESPKIDVSTQISRYSGATNGTALNERRGNSYGDQGHPKSKYKMLSCLYPGSVVQKEAYQTNTSSETPTQNGTAHKQSPHVCESSAQTIPTDNSVDMGQQTSKDDKEITGDDKLTQTMVDFNDETSQTVVQQSSEVAVQVNVTEFHVDCMSQTSLEVKEEEEYFQTKVDPVAADNATQTYVVDNTDEEMQAVPDVNDVKLQTSREYLTDGNSQTKPPPSTTDVPSQTTKEFLVDGIMQTIILNKNETSMQTCKDYLTDTITQTTLPPVVAVATSQTCTIDVKSIETQTLTKVDVKEILSKWRVKAARKTVNAAQAPSDSVEQGDEAHGSIQTGDADVENFLQMVASQFRTVKESIRFFEDIKDVK